jgi:hypothetical protein
VPDNESDPLSSAGPLWAGSHEGRVRDPRRGPAPDRCYRNPALDQPRVPVSTTGLQSLQGDVLYSRTSISKELGLYALPLRRADLPSAKA